MKTLTVGDIRQAIQGVPDNVVVVVCKQDPPANYDNVGKPACEAVWDKPAEGSKDPLEVGVFYIMVPYLEPMFYYHVYICYGGQNGKSIFFKSPKDLHDEDAIFDEAVALGRIDPDEGEFVQTAEQTSQEDYEASGGDKEWETSQAV